MSVLLLDHGDIEAILAIQALCPEIAQWTQRDYSDVAIAYPNSVPSDAPSSTSVGWVARRNGVVIGFLVARRVVNDVELLNLAVHPDVRSSGVGTSLLHAFLDWSGALQSENIFLEVRASNRAALQFYERHGFHATGRRQSYYTAPVEDALLLTLALKHR